jgi:hypothetical protein
LISATGGYSHQKQHRQRQTQDNSVRAHHLPVLSFSVKGNGFFQN